MRKRTHHVKRALYREERRASHVHTDSPAYVSSRRFGEATVTVINDGTALWAQNFAVPEQPLRAAMPEMDARGRIRIGFHVVHIRIGARIHPCGCRVR